jgi:type II secretory pathway component GspD/PulD (secretin)
MLSPVWILTAAAITLIGVAHNAYAQQTDNKPAEQKPDFGRYQTLYLTNVTNQHDALDIVSDLRNMLPTSKIYYVNSENAVSMRGTPEDFQLAQKILSEVDKPKKVYRLTYTITDTDDGKPVGAQRVALIAAVSGGKTTLKQGRKVPIVTGTMDKGASGQESQVQYEDVGLMIEASLDEHSAGLTLRTKVEQSSLADEKPGISVADPVVHQMILEETSNLEQGKAVVLGSLDVPGSTHHQEVEVVSELVR